MANEYIGKQAKMEKEGVLHAQYGKEWFVKVKADYDNDRIIWSFANKSDAKNHSGDVFMEVRDFYEWMRDIRTGEFYKVILSEKQAGEQYPKEYKIQSGENGAKTVGFAGSSNAFAIINFKIPNKADKGKNDFGNIPVTKLWLKSLSTMFFATLEEYGWLKKAAIKTLNGASNRFKPANAKEESGSEEINYSDESKNVTEKNNKPDMTIAEAIAKNVVEEKENTAQTDGTYKNRFVGLEVADLKSGSGFCVKAETADSHKPVVLIFLNNEIKTNSKVNQFKTMVGNQTRTPFRCEYIVKNGKNYFHSFV